MIKILLTGSTSSGKTTLLNELEMMNIPGVYLVQEVARDLLNKNPGIEKTPNFQDIVFLEQISREKQADTGETQVAICDRGVIDIIAFSRYFKHSVKNEWVKWCKTYNTVFLCDINDINFELTPLQRLLDKRDWHQHRIDVDKCIKSVLSEYNISYIILSGTEKVRAEKIKKEIHLLSKNKN